MKKILFTVSAVLLLAQGNVFAQNDNDNKNEKKTKYEFEKSKTYNKSYSVSSSDKINFDNKFGNVEIHTWNKSEVKVDVEIKVSAKTEEWAKSVLDDIAIEDSKSGNVVKFKTLFSEDLDKKEGGTRHKDKYKNKNASQSMEVNYSVYMPASNPLDIDNQFGAIILPDYTGEVDLTSKFGKLETGNLSNVKSINVEFGKAKLGNVPGGNLSIKFSTASIGKISGNIKANIDFSDKIALNMDNNLSNLDLRVSYSNISLVPAGNLGANYSISTNFGSFKNRTDVKFTSDEDNDDNRGPKFDNEYNGKSGSGNVPVKIKSSFSTVILGEATEADFKKKDKVKSKTS